MRWLAAVVASVALLLALAACSQEPAGRSGAAGTGSASGTTTTTLLPAPGGVNSAIGPRPGEGVEPTSKDDRGGWLQLSVGAALFAGVVAIGGLAWRDARRRAGNHPA
jgi:hypothetical protein